MALGRAEYAEEMTGILEASLVGDGLDGEIAARQQGRSAIKTEQTQGLQRRAPP